MIIQRRIILMDKDPTGQNHERLSTTRKTDMVTKVSMVDKEKSTIPMAALTSKVTIARTTMMTCGDCTVPTPCFLSNAYTMELSALFKSGWMDLRVWFVIFLGGN
jgi:hypothetical protein